MTLRLDRRQLMGLAATGIGLLATSGRAAELLTARGFTHSVASGEPDGDSVLLWTRYVGTADTVLTCELSETPDFARIVGGTMVVAGFGSDWTAKAVVSGLRPATRYHYRFVAPDGTASPVGMTKTLPVDGVDPYRIAVFSCANLPFGFFNAYGHAADAADEFDLAMSLGDYFYEYEPGKYPSTAEAVASRRIEPANETVTLADYRLRYATYRADPDLQRLHAVLPMVAMWDDHEIANDDWTLGAQNHQPDTEGDWTTRRRAAERAWEEWMPVRPGRHRTYRVGDLATLILPDTRVTGRAKQLSFGEVLAGRSPDEYPAALAAFRDGAWSDPARTMMGGPQEALVAAELTASTRAGTRWQVIGQGTILGSLRAPAEVARWVPADAPDYVRARLASDLAAADAGLPLNLDSWDGYPAARSRLLTAAMQADANLIVLAGDSHNAWAFDLDEGGQRAGVEFDGQSVTSPGYESFLRGASEADRSRALVQASPALKWANTRDRGYMAVTLERDRAVSEWRFLDTIRTRSTKLQGTHRLAVRHGERRLASV